MLILTRAVLFAAVAFAHWRLFLPCDDAFIHLRIARNLIETGEPYYNPGEPHMASSSSVWSLVLAGFMSIFGEARFELVRILNLAICLVGALIWGRLLRRLSGNRTATLIGEVLFLGLTASASISLMETPLALAVAGLAVSRLIDRRAGGIALLAVAGFIRPEMTIGLLFAIGIELLRKRQRNHAILHMTAEVVVGSIPLVLYGVWFFGGILPATVRAKAIVYDVASSEQVQLIFRALLGDIAVKSRAGAIAYSAGILVALLWLAFTKLRRENFTRPESLACATLILSGGLLLFSYIEEGVMLFHWYIPLFTVPITMGLGGLACALNVPALRALAGLALVPAVLGIANLVSGSIDESLHPDFASAARVRSYLSIGRELRERFPEARLLSSEIGGLGWTFRGEVLDGAGLVSPDALAYHPLKVPEERPSGMLAMIPPGLVNAKLPELIVSMDVFLNVDQIPELRALYTVEEHPVFLPEDAARMNRPFLWQSAHTNVWIRRDILGSQSPRGVLRKAPGARGRAPVAERSAQAKGPERRARKRESAKRLAR